MRVHYGVSADTDAIGFDLVAVGYDPSRFRGFPVTTAEVEFGQHGYRNMFGWIQIVTRTATGNDIARTRRLVPLTGFSWGYRLAAGRPEPLPAAPLAADRWTAHGPGQLSELVVRGRCLVTEDR